MPNFSSYSIHASQLFVRFDMIIVDIIMTLPMQILSNH